MAEQLRMEAVVTDKFSDPLRRLQERLNSVKSPEHLKELGEHFEGIRTKVEKLSEAMKVGLEPAMSGLGISGLSLGGTFAGLMQATRAFAESTASLSRLSSETGISIERIREMDSVFGKLGVKAEAVNGSMVTFRQNLHDIQRNRGATFGWLTAQEPQLAKQLHDAKNPDEALGRAYEFLQRIPDPTERADAAQRLFGTSEIGRIAEMSKPEIAAAIREADEAQGKISESAKKASEEWEKATGRLHDALIGLRDDIGSQVLPYLNKMTDAATSFIQGHHVATVVGGAAGSGAATAYGAYRLRKLFGSLSGAEGPAGAASTAAERVGRSGLQPSANDNYAFRAANDNVAEAASGSSIFGRMAPKMGAALRFLGPMSWPLMLRDIGEARSPTTPQNFPYKNDTVEPGWVSTWEKSRRAAEEMRRDPEAARGRNLMRLHGVHMIEGVPEETLRDTQSRATRDGTVDGLKKATPDAEKAVKGWFDWIWKSSLAGGDSPGFGGGARLWNAGYEVGNPAGGGMQGRSPIRRFHGGGRFGLSGSMGGGSGRFASIPPGAPGTYRPPYHLGDADLDDRVVNTVAGEVSTKNAAGVDAVINNMMNRVGSKGWGPSGNLLEVARAPGQYAGYRRATSAEKAFIRSRIQAIASGGVEDNTHGSNSYRAGYYHGPWYQKHAADGIMIGGNRFAFENGVSNGPYAPYRNGAAPGADLAGRMYPHDWRRVLDANRSLTQGTGMGFLGAAQVNPEGNVTVNLHGFPHGTRANTSADGFFKDVKVNRGRQMHEADADT